MARSSHICSHVRLDRQRRAVEKFLRLELYRKKPYDKSFLMVVDFATSILFTGAHIGTDGFAETIDVVNSRLFGFDYCAGLYRIKFSARWKKKFSHLLAIAQNGV